MARLLGASFATLLIAALAAVGFAYPALFPEPLASPAHDIDAAEQKVPLKGSISFEMRGSLSEADVLESLAIEPEPPLWPPALQIVHHARFSWHERFDWAKTRVTLNPSRLEIFAPETTYTITADGKRLLTFETITLPRLVGARASQIDPDGSGAFTTSSSVVLLFNERIVWDDDLLEVHPRSGYTADTRETESGRTEVWITPESRWENLSTYTLRVGSGVEDVHGHRSVEPFRYAFNTWPTPTILSVGPASDDEPPDAPVVVSFERDADRKTVEESFKVEPAASGSFEWASDRLLTWRPADLDYSTRYSVSVAGKSVDGDSFPEAAWSFETQDPPVFVEIQGSTDSPTILTAVVKGGLATHELEWSDGETSARRLVVAPAKQTRDLHVTVRSGDQTATATVQLRGPSVDPGHTPAPCPSGWEMIDISVCYLRQTLPGPVQVYVTRVDVGDPAITLRSLPAADKLGHVATVGQAAQAHGAVAAVNGDFFGLATNSYFPLGPMVSEGKLIYRPPGNVPVLAIDTPARSWVGTANDFPARTQLPQVDFAVGGSHVLLRGGRPLPVTGEHGGLNPRTAIGIDAAGFVFLVTVDGRSYHSIGMTLPSLQDYLLGLGVANAVNLDGGGSSTMAIRGAVVNSPSDGRERPVATVVEVVRR